MISVFVDCAKAWTRLVQAYHRVLRRPQVTLDRPPVVTKGARP